MGIPLSTYAISRDNNFNFIRFIAAFLVLFSHSFTLALGSGDTEPLRQILDKTWGSIAVDIFFVTSGFLITSSYFSRNNLIAFVWARVLRIYPALIVAIIFCVFLVGISFTTLSTNEYLFHHETQKYLFKNIILFFGVEFRLPGVFLDVPYKNAVNGSLWTLPYEVKMYAILAFILGLVAFMGKKVKFITFGLISLLIGISSISLYLFNHFQSLHPDQFIRLFYMFFVGVAFFIWREKIFLSSTWAFLAIVILLLSSIYKDLFFIVYCLALPYLIFYVAYVPSGQIRKFNKYGDYSYGIYIYAFPVQQSLAQIIPHISVPIMILASFLITLLLSFLSWHLIEKKFIRMKGSYIFIENFIQKIWLTKLWTWRK